MYRLPCRSGLFGSSHGHILRYAATSTKANSGRIVKWRNQTPMQLMHSVSRESGSPFSPGLLRTDRYRGHLSGKLNTRTYSNVRSTEDAEGEIICSTEEHAPGHNVATITVSNPKKLNIVNSPLLRDIIETCQQLSVDDNLRAVVLAGAPTAEGKAPSWIGGMDIREMSNMNSYETAKKFITLVHEACDAFRQIPVPVIAKVHGFSLGAGLEIMAACDLKIATEISTFGMPEVKIGLPSVVEAALMPGQIGMGRTRRLMYLAENISAEMAERWGLIEKVVEDGAALDRAVDEWVQMIVNNGPKSIRSQKRLMQKWENTTPEQGIQAGVEALAATFADGGKEPREMMAKFLNRKR